MWNRSLCSSALRPFMNRTSDDGQDELVAFTDGNPGSLLKSTQRRKKRLAEWLSDEELRLLAFLQECGGEE